MKIKDARVVLGSGLRVTAVAFIVGTLLGCGGQPEAAAPPAPEVTVATPEVRDVTVFQEFVGSTEAYQSVEIRARVQGFLDRMTFEPSSFVRKGQLLFVIEPEPYEAQRDRALANLKAAEAGLRRAESDLDRLEQAVRTNAVSQQEVTRARAERDQASASVLQAQAALTNAEIQLDYTTLEAPIDGLVTRNYVDLGNLVGSGENTLLTTVRDIDPIYAYFEVSERFVARILEQREGYRDPDEGGVIPATLILEETGHEIVGEIDSLENTVDTGTGTIRIRGIFPNADAKIFPGFFVRVRLPGELYEDALLVEETALGTDLGGRYLMIVGENDIVERRYVEPGQLQDDNTRLILDGLEAGERYIVKGLQRARPGMPVSPKTAGSGS
jgi:RND family efflux transporter MFP subunit